MKISTVSQMRHLDQTAMEEYGIPGKILMENAGLAVFSALSMEMGIRGQQFIIFCGMGNNGGDGFVVARKIHSNGGHVKVFILGDRNKYTGDSKHNLDIINRIIPRDILEVDSPDYAKFHVNHCTAIIDAILGTGLIRNVEGFYRDIIELINASGKPVFSVDIPSGIDGDTGKIMGVAVKAHATVTFGLPKIGNILYPGFEYCGKLYVSHISFPSAMYRDLDICLNTGIDIPKRNKGFHKGQFGNLLCIAGAAGYFGAPYFSAFSFLKAGGGYSRLAAPRSITSFIAQKGSEIVFLPQAETLDGSLSLANKDALLSLSASMDMVVLGPGVSLNEETQQLVRELAAEIEAPLLIDGDGITAVCKNIDLIRNRNAPTILTPHMGEMSRIADVNPKEIEKDKISILKQTARDLGAVVVLKGPHSLIGCPDGRIFINLSGNCGMATAGSGDVLTGAIAAMYAAGMSIEDAVRKGVFIHGLSGDLAALEKGEDGMTAQDVLDFLPRAVKEDRNGLSEALSKRYLGPHVL